MKIALELVEMPLRRAIEINRDGARNVAANTLGDEPRRFVQHQRCTIRRAEDDAGMTAPAVGNDDRERTGEFARFAAQLQIAPAGIRRHLCNAYALDDLVRGERRFKDTGRKLGAFDRRRPPGPQTMTSASKAART